MYVYHMYLARLLTRLLANLPCRLPDYVPPTKPYHLSELITDLLAYASALLLPGGRLVFWLPTMNEDHAETAIPHHDHFDLVAHSIQNFGRWSRRVRIHLFIPFLPLFLYIRDSSTHAFSSSLQCKNAVAPRLTYPLPMLTSLFLAGFVRMTSQTSSGTRYVILAHVYR